MLRFTIPACLFLSAATTSWAQEDALLPTHLIDGGQVFVTGSFQYLQGKGDADFPTSSGDFKQKAYQVLLDAGVGLGMGFEIDASIAGQIRGTTKADLSTPNIEVETESRGFSDLTLTGLYRILKNDAVTPQLIVGGILVAPVGNDKKGAPEISSGGITVKGAESGIGQGVWHYGLAAGISKSLTVVEPYLLTSYVFGGKRRENGVNEDRSDVWNVTAGARWYLSSEASIDTRAIFNRNGREWKEDSGVQVKEETHFTYTGEANLYLRLGSGVTLILGGGAFFIEDHEVNNLARIDLKDDVVWFVQAGLHVLLGGK